MTTEQSAALEKVCHLFTDWRKAKTARERIPDRLWQAAADLYHTRKMTINRIARGLGLNHSALKEKILDMPPAAIDPPEEVASSLFIEVEAPQGYSDCVIEMENQTGIKMRMCLRGRADPAVLTWADIFWQVSHDSDHAPYADTSGSRTRRFQKRHRRPGRDMQEGTAI